MSRAALQTIRDIAAGSTSASSLPHIVRLCDAALDKPGFTDQQIVDALFTVMRGTRLRPSAITTFVAFARRIEKLHGVGA